MKNLFKFLLVAVMIATFGFGAKAQSNANADMAASATVLAALTIANTHAVAFGNLSATTAGTVYLNPKLTGSTYVGTAAAVGTFTLTGSPNASVQLGYPATIPLSNGATGTMTYTLAVNGLNENSQGGSGLLVPTGNLVSVQLGGTSGTSTKYYLWVGGNLGTLGGQETGIYTGTANFTVTYN